MLVLLAVIILGLAAFYLQTVNIPVLEPAGVVGQKERKLIIIAVLLALIVVIPVYVMLIGFAWHYREGNEKALYRPDFDHSRRLESLWWGVPMAIILTLSIITWKSSNELDPFKKLSSTTPEMNIQVVALQWKWLFIYPQQKVASVNFVQLPLNTPINFEITADAPMNSFWIPQLGGQIYAMSGMSTHLHLMADKAGAYYGSSANISGDGFAGMNFIARASSEREFNSWIGQASSTTDELSLNSYNKLALPSQNNPVSYYKLADKNLYDKVINKYLEPVYFNPAQRSL